LRERETERERKIERVSDLAESDEAGGRVEPLPLDWRIKVHLLGVISALKGRATRLFQLP